MRRVLVTGAAGFIGANAVRRLLSDGDDVHAIVRPGSAAWRLGDLRRDVLLHQLDIREPQAVHRAVRAIRPDWVLHLAACGVYPWQTDPYEVSTTNFLGTVHLVEACVAAGVDVFVHAGSSAEHGATDCRPSEPVAPPPNSAYGLAKASATRFCRHMAARHHARIVALRLYSVYGPFEDFRRLVPALMISGFRNEWPPLSRPDVARDWIYVDDAVDALLRCASRPRVEPGSVFDVGTGVQTTLGQLVALVRELLHITADPRWGTLPDRPWDSAPCACDPGPLETALGWRPPTTVREGLARTRDWLLVQHRRLEHYRAAAVS